MIPIPNRMRVVKDKIDFQPKQEFWVVVHMHFHQNVNQRQGIKKKVASIVEKLLSSQIIDDFNSRECFFSK